MIAILGSDWEALGEFGKHFKSILAEALDIQKNKKDVFSVLVLDIFDKKNIQNISKI